MTKIVLVALLMSLMAVTVVGSPAVFAWDLHVDLSTSNFGDDRVCASLEGGYGYGPVQECTRAGSDASVTFDVGDRIDSRENYVVCGYSGILERIFGACDNFTHGEGDEWIGIDA